MREIVYAVEILYKGRYYVREIESSELTQLLRKQKWVCVCVCVCVWGGGGGGGGFYWSHLTVHMYSPCRRGNSDLNT